MAHTPEHTETDLDKRLKNAGMGHLLTPEKVEDISRGSKGALADIFADLALATSASAPQGGFAKLAQGAKSGAQGLLFNEFLTTGKASSRLSAELRGEGARLQQSGEQITSQAELNKSRISQIDNLIENADLTDLERFDLDLEKLQLNSDFSLAEKLIVGEQRFIQQLEIIDKVYANNAGTRKIERQKVAIKALDHISTSARRGYGPDGIPLDNIADRENQAIDQLVAGGVFTEAEVSPLRPRGSGKDPFPIDPNNQVKKFIKDAGGATQEFEGEKAPRSDRPEGRSRPLAGAGSEKDSTIADLKARASGQPTSSDRAFERAEQRAKTLAQSKLTEKEFTQKSLVATRQFVKSLSNFDALSREEQILLLTDSEEGVPVSTGRAFGFGGFTGKNITGVSREIAEQALAEQAKIDSSIQGVPKKVEPQIDAQSLEEANQIQARRLDTERALSNRDATFTPDKSSIDISPEELERRFQETVPAEFGEEFSATKLRNRRNRAKSFLKDNDAFLVLPIDSKMKMLRELFGFSRAVALKLAQEIK